MPRKRAVAKPKGVQVELAADLTIKHIGEHKAALAAVLGDDGEPVTIRAAGVTEVDTAGLQLLIAFVKALGARGRAVDWHEPSAQIVEASRALGVEPALGFGALSR